jgi:hypothetical protein
LLELRQLRDVGGDPARSVFHKPQELGGLYATVLH